MYRNNYLTREIRCVTFTILGRSYFTHPSGSESKCGTPTKFARANTDLSPAPDDQ